MAYTTRKSLLDRIKNGDEEAWYDFYERHYRLIYSIGRRFDLPGDLCNDLIQQVMMAVFNNRMTFRYQPELGKFRSYLFGITKNIIWRIKKGEIQKTATTEILKSEKEFSEEKMDEIIAEEWHNYLFETLISELRQRVEENTFDAFQMYILQGVKPETVAKTLNISTSAVYVYKNRCMNHLRQLVKEIQQYDPDFVLN